MEFRFWNKLRNKLKRPAPKAPDSAPAPAGDLPAAAQPADIAQPAVPESVLQQETERLYAALNSETPETWKAYLAHYTRLAPALQARLGFVFAYALSAEGGFFTGNHPLGHFRPPREIRVPFRANWWFYPPPDWNANCMGGFVYQIDPNCFSSRDPLLYYEDEDLTGKDNWLTQNLLRMAEVSRGITDVKLASLPAEGEERTRCVITFRLRPGVCGEVFPRVELSDPSAEGTCLACIPRSGEFRCSFGEVIDGKRVTLAVDSYCMK